MRFSTLVTGFAAVSFRCRAATLAPADGPADVIYCGGDIVK
jgi:hypothetical protein